MPRLHALVRVALLTSMPTLALADPPKIAGISPYGAKRGAPTDATFAGASLAGNPQLVAPFACNVENLPGSDAANWKVKLTVAADVALGVYPVRIRTDGGLSNPFLFAVGQVGQVAEVEDNSTFEQAQAITPPVVVEGQSAGNDVDYFKFAGKKGAKLVIQALTYELALNTEVLLKVLDAKGAELAKSNPQQAGVRVEFTPPADGDFYISCENTNYVSGPNEVYHLSVRPAAPDFTVTVGLDRIDAPVGGLGLLPITGVTRVNGFAGPIDVTFAGVDGVTGTLTIPAAANPQPVSPLYLPITVKAGTKPGAFVGLVKATAKIDGKDVTRISTLLDATKAAFGGMPNPPTEVAQQVAVAVVPEPPFALTLTFEKSEVAKGGTLKGKLSAKRADKFAEEIVIVAVSVPVSAMPKLKNVAKDGKDVEVEFTIPVSVPLGPGVVILRGTAKVAGKDVSALVTATVTVIEAKKEEPKKEEPKKKDEPKKK